MNYRIDSTTHSRRAWRADELLAPDFEIEDAWRLPVRLESHHSLALFQRQFRLALADMMQSGFAAQLFKLRFFLGRLFGWDDKEPRTSSAPDVAKHHRLKPGSLRARFAELPGNSAADLAAPDQAIDENFTAVYNLENESLAELENATVHAALHLARVPDPAEAKAYTIELTVYVRPKGLFGRTYMQAIKPMRLAIVYPTIMKAAGKQWRLYLTRESADRRSGEESK